MNAKIRNAASKGAMMVQAIIAPFRPLCAILWGGVGKVTRREKENAV